jgi:hypothetical protein
MYQDMLQINEAIQVARPVPLLIKNPICKGDKAMTENTIPQDHNNYQPKYNRRIYQTDDLIGEKFGKLTVIKELSPDFNKEGGPIRKVLCKCDCGNTSTPLLINLMAGYSRSCGCTQAEKIATANKTHGLSGHPIHNLWKRIKQRCLNPNDKDYADYGGRGITICDEWKDDFKMFYDWAISHGWEKGLVIDREDVNGGYYPDNCRFVGNGLSARNQRLLKKNNKSGYRGLTKRANGKWTAIIGYNRKLIRLGTYETRVEAAKAYDKKAIELDAGHPLNFPDVLTDAQIDEWTGQP